MRIIKPLIKTRGLDPSRMMEEILKSVSEFILQAEQSNDVSIIDGGRRCMDKFYTYGNLWDIRIIVFVNLFLTLDELFR